MSGINWHFAVSFGFLLCLTLLVWTLAIREALDIANDWPSACSTLTTASDCAARMSEAR